MNKISIIIATYNGEKYIEEQLQSLYDQTLKPDEVLIFDDCSKDKTVAIVKEFIKKGGLKNWEIEINKENKGWRKNFIDGLKKTSHDFIFLCDQDDIWEKDKIEKMINIMRKNDKVLLLSTNYNYLYGNKIKKNRYSNDNRIIYNKLEKNYLYPSRPGCTYCVRRLLLNLALDSWLPFESHDALLWKTSLILDGNYTLNYPSIKFRRHNNNATKLDILKVNRKERICNSIKITENLLKNKNVLRKIDKKNKNILTEIIKFNNFRIEFIDDSKLFFSIKIYFKYRLFYLSARTYIGDLIYMFFYKKEKNKC